MYRILFALLFTAGAITLSQAQPEETLFENARVVGGFGGPTITLAEGDGVYGVGAGGGGGVIVNSFFLGGFGQGESYGRRTFNDTRYTVSLGYGGLWLGYVYPSHKVVHLFNTVKLGWGGVSLNNFSEPINIRDSDGVFVINPEVGVELNVLHWFRIAGTVGYRFVEGIEPNRLPDISENDFNSPTFALTFRFGGFGYGSDWDDDEW
jgi:hypothetical protein